MFYFYYPVSWHTPFFFSPNPFFPFRPPHDRTSILYILSPPKDLFYIINWHYTLCLSVSFLFKLMFLPSHSFRKKCYLSLVDHPLNSPPTFLPPVCQINALFWSRNILFFISCFFGPHHATKAFMSLIFLPFEIFPPSLRWKKKSYLWLRNEDQKHEVGSRTLPPQCNRPIILDLCFFFAMFQPYLHLSFWPPPFVPPVCTPPPPTISWMFIPNPPRPCAFSEACHKFWSFTHNQ